jgi:hypothetical protein
MLKDARHCISEIRNFIPVKKYQSIMFCVTCSLLGLGLLFSVTKISIGFYDSSPTLDYAMHKLFLVYFSSTLQAQNGME